MDRTIASTTEQTVASTGEMLAAISTGLVRLIREDYGRGPMSAKTHVLDDMIVCVLRNSGLTSMEQTMMEGGRPQRIAEMRQEVNELMRGKLEDMVEGLTGVPVIASLSQTDVEHDLSLQVFLLERPLNGTRTGPAAQSAPPA